MNPKPEPEKQDAPAYGRSDFMRDLGKASRKLEPDEKKKPKGRRPSGRSPKTA